jgi:hypothetical protein
LKQVYRVEIVLGLQKAQVVINPKHFNKYTRGGGSEHVRIAENVIKEEIGQ